MHQVKIFKTVDNELGDLESQINRWIVETKANVIAIEEETVRARKVSECQAKIQR